MSFFSDENDDDNFRDVPDEIVEGQQAPPAQVRTTRPPAPSPVQQQAVPEPEQEEIYEEASDEDEDFSDVLNDARFRLEQGRLYELIMNNNIFEGSGGDEKAVKYVMKQVRNFAKEQMEIMLGMKQEKSESQPLSAADFPFNDLEVQTLKALASAATKGATASPAAQSFSGVQVDVPKQTAFKPIGMTAKSAPQVSAPTPKPVAKASKPLQSKPVAPVKRKNEADIEKILQEEGISREEYERQYNPDYTPLNKPFDNMSEEEIRERNRQIALRSTKQVKNPAAIPMPTQEQEEMLHSQRAQSAASHPQMQLLMSALTKKK